MTAFNLELNTLPSILFLSLSLIALLGAAAAILRSSYTKAQIEGLRGDRDDLTKRLDESREEGRSCRTEVEKLRGELLVESQRREALEKVVTAKQELVAVIEILKAHDHRAEAIQNGVKKLLDRSDPKPPGDRR
jgi:chromosome segregation ATPase